MKKKKGKEFHLEILAAAVALAFSFGIMPSLLAAAPADGAVRIISSNEAPLYEEDIQEATPDFNAISGKQATASALEALKAQGFDIQEFESQPVELQYVAETVPAGDPVWAVIFRDDQEGYASVFGTEIDQETREKLAAVGQVEACTDKNGVPGLRAWYSYTRYTLVEINAFSGQYVRHGETIVSLGSPLQIDQTHWVPTTEEAWEAERQKQEELQQAKEN
ncbi:MAG: hypothetical protein HFE73_00850 [Firmicutes bacterium]|nr:hypothetical protein [Bacillota bacterium]